jgi:hypothetical protein
MPKYLAKSGDYVASLFDSEDSPALLMGVCIGAMNEDVRSLLINKEGEPDRQFLAGLIYTFIQNEKNPEAPVDIYSEALPDLTKEITGSALRIVAAEINQWRSLQGDLEDYGDLDESEGTEEPKGAEEPEETEPEEESKEN